MLTLDNIKKIRQTGTEQTIKEINKPNTKLTTEAIANIRKNQNNMPTVAPTGKSAFEIMNKATKQGNVSTMKTNAPAVDTYAEMIKELGKKDGIDYYSDLWDIQSKLSSKSKYTKKDYSKGNPTAKDYYYDLLDAKRNQNVFDYIGNKINSVGQKAASFILGTTEGQGAGGVSKVAQNTIQGGTAFGSAVREALGGEISPNEILSKTVENYKDYKENLPSSEYNVQTMYEDLGNNQTERTIGNIAGGIGYNMLLTASGIPAPLVYGLSGGLSEYGKTDSIRDVAVETVKGAVFGKVLSKIKGLQTGKAIATVGKQQLATYGKEFIKSFIAFIGANSANQALDIFKENPNFDYVDWGKVETEIQNGKYKSVDEYLDSKDYILDVTKSRASQIILNSIIGAAFDTGFKALNDRVSNKNATTARKDNLKILGLKENATPEEIKKAYRTLSKQYHPDLHPELDGSKFKEIARAYQELSQNTSTPTNVARPTTPTTTTSTTSTAVTTPQTNIVNPTVQNAPARPIQPQAAQITPEATQKPTTIKVQKETEVNTSKTDVGTSLIEQKVADLISNNDDVYDTDIDDLVGKIVNEEYKDVDIDSDEDAYDSYYNRIEQLHEEARQALINQGYEKVKTYDDSEPSYIPSQKRLDGAINDLNVEYGKRPSNTLEVAQLDKIRENIDNIISKIETPENISISKTESKSSLDATYIDVYDEAADEYKTIRVANHYKEGVSGKADYNIYIDEYKSIDELNKAIEVVVKEAVEGKPSVDITNKVLYNTEELYDDGRATKQGELVNKFKRALTQKQWVEYFKKVDNHGAKYNFGNNEKNIIVIGNKVVFSTYSNGKPSVYDIVKLETKLLKTYGVTTKQYISELVKVGYNEEEIRKIVKDNGEKPIFIRNSNTSDTITDGGERTVKNDGRIDKNSTENEKRTGLLQTNGSVDSNNDVKNSEEQGSFSLPKKEKIDDFGEKIGGARKDLWSGTKKHSTKEVVHNYTINKDLVETEEGDMKEVYSVAFKGKVLKDDFKSEAEAEKFIEEFKTNINNNRAKVTEGYVRDKDGNKITRFTIEVVDPKTLRSRDIGKSFETREEAESFAMALSMYLAEHGKNLFRPHIQKVTRINPDYKNSTKATGQQILDTFKFRGGEFGNWVNNEERQKFLNYGYDALTDLAIALDILPSDLGFGGKMAVAFGARGKGLSGALAHFEPIKKVFNMTKLKGAGSAAHEMGHALDNYLSQLSGYDEAGMLSSNQRYRNLPESITKAFRELLDNIQYSFSTNEEEITKKNALFEKSRINSLQTHLNYYDRVFKGEATKYARKKGEYQRVPIEVTEEQKKEYNKIREILMEGKLKDKREYKDFTKTKAIVEYDKPLEDLKKLIKTVTNRKMDDDTVYWLYKYGIPSKQISQIRSESAFSKSARELDQFLGRASIYHAKIEEMLARSFETFVYDELKKKGITNDYLVHSVYSENYALFNPYPAGEERAEMNKSWRKLINAMKEEGIFHDADSKAEVIKHDIKPLKKDFKNYDDYASEDTALFNAILDQLDRTEIAETQWNLMVQEYGEEDLDMDWQDDLGEFEEKALKIVFDKYVDSPEGIKFVNDFRKKLYEEQAGIKHDIRIEKKNAPEIKPEKKLLFLVKK